MPCKKRGVAVARDEEESGRGGGGGEDGGEESAFITETFGPIRELAAGSPDAIEPAIAPLEEQVRGKGPLMARLNAYRAIVDFDRHGSVEGYSRGPAQAQHELHELENGALRLDVARAVCKHYADRFGDNEVISRHLSLLSGRGNGFGRWRDNPKLDVQVIPRPGADRTMIIFCGFRHRFVFAMNLWYHGWLAAYPANVIVLRDWERLLYLTGVASIGNMEQTVAELKRILESLGSKKTVTCGNSGGGLGALQYGVLLNADHTITFSPAIDLEHILNYTGRQMRTRLTEYRDQRRIVWPDIRNMIERQPQMKSLVFFADENEIDRKHAALLDGLPNVTFSKVKDMEAHVLLPTLAAKGLLDGALAQVLQ
jgi:pimeloyl-ACP methyl ester carboxylesterase